MEQTEKRSMLRELMIWVICIASAIAVALLLRIYVFELVRVDGSSMEPTLSNKHTMFVEKLSTRFHNLKRFDVIIVEYPGRDGEYVKRIVGMEGDRVRVTDGYLYVNDEKYIEDYTLDPVMYHDMEEVTVPEGHVFVMGDNRNNSMDSTSPSVGPISYESIIGRARFVIFPITKMHTIK